MATVRSLAIPPADGVGPPFEFFALQHSDIDSERALCLDQLDCLDSACRGAAAVPRGNSFERTLRYALERRAFGKPIGKHQAIRHKLAEVALRIEAGRDITYAALCRYLAGEDAVRVVTIAKLARQRAAFEVMDSCLQIDGGAGYMVGTKASGPPETLGLVRSAAAPRRS